MSLGSKDFTCRLQVVERLLTMGSFKVVLVGETEVGKTTILCYLKTNRYDPRTEPTIGATFLHYCVQDEEKSITLQIWDTAGQEKYRALAPLYYRSALWAIIVYDVTNLESFQKIDGWADEIKKRADSPVKLVIVGNKSDLDEKRQVTQEMREQLAEKIGATFSLETSAVSGTGIHELFTRIGRESIITEEPVINAPKIVEAQKTSGGCCS